MDAYPAITEPVPPLPMCEMRPEVVRELMKLGYREDEITKLRQELYREGRR